MASKEYERLIDMGFSPRFLRSSAANHPEARRAIIGHEETWRLCSVCRKRYADMTTLLHTHHNAKTAQHVRDVGMCSHACAEEQYGSREAAYKAIKAIHLAGGPQFYESREWKELRYKVLTELGGACMCCGRTRKDGVKIHVDHIKPRYLYPHLALTKNNLQVLCEECNIGKSFHDETDWRN